MVMESCSPCLSPTKLQSKVLALFLVLSAPSPRVARIWGRKFPYLEMDIQEPHIVRLCAHKPSCALKAVCSAQQWHLFHRDHCWCWRQTCRFGHMDGGCCEKEFLGHFVRSVTASGFVFLLLLFCCLFILDTRSHCEANPPASAS